MKLLGMVISGFQRAGGAMEVDHIGWRWRKNFLVLKKIKVEFDGIVTKINVVRGKVMQTSCSYYGNSTGRKLLKYTWCSSQEKVS